MKTSALATTALAVAMLVQAHHARALGGPVTYDVNVQEGIDNGGVITPNVNDLTGSFVYNAGVFSSINLLINGQGATDVPVQTGSGGITSLLFSYTFSPSETTFYSFNINHPLGGSAHTIGINSVVFSPFDSLEFGNDVCGSPLHGQSGPHAETYTCSGHLTKVPELGWSGAAGAATLLCGVLLLTRMRRSSRPG
jgi:hypothetical protein